MGDLQKSTKMDYYLLFLPTVEEGMLSNDTLEQALIQKST